MMREKEGKEGWGREGNGLYTEWAAGKGQRVDSIVEV